MPRYIALVDFRWEGHHPTFFRQFHAALTSLDGVQVACFCPSPDDSEISSRTASRGLPAEKLTDEVLAHRWLRKLPALANEFRFRQLVGRIKAYERTNGVEFDFVFIACLYQGAFLFPRWLPRIFPYRWSALLLDSSFARLSWWQRALRNRTTDSIAAFKAPNCLSVATLDRPLVSELQERLGPRHRVVSLPEIAAHATSDTTFPLLETLIQKAAGRKILGSFGQFSRRKGSFDFLDAVEQCINEPWFFFWAGALDPTKLSAAETRRLAGFLNGVSSNCLLNLHRVDSDDAFSALIAACDGILLRYRDHPGSSNVLVKAAALRRPVIVSESGCMADLTREYGLGLCLPITTAPEEYQETIRRLLAGEGFNPRYAEIADENDVEVFRANVKAMLSY